MVGSAFAASVKLTNAKSSTTLITKDAPHLRVADGCVLVLAVDCMGNVGDGLKPTGNPSGERLVRARPTREQRSSGTGSPSCTHAACRMPKTDPSAHLGHRHKSSYQHSITSALDAAAPLFYYDSKWPKMYELYYDTLKGQQESLFIVDLPLVAWDSPPTTIQKALVAADFGDDEVVLFTDAHFNGTL
ncbi:hypothetical protein KVR01_012327 [Diaporthe batatas]|uniref:uncharacterized protein n=1 Tax=Diaporthe batatas TaxID=748121 RepID=UPI001D045A70|nr:uncharacterized protein KVR01_012327 [Diaporthe batatas]KAG8157665.1 hypothetical protein KVR01_012327 [Diaporthe batatas]